MYKSQIKGLNKVLKDLEKFGDEATEDIFIITKKFFYRIFSGQIQFRLVPDN